MTLATLLADLSSHDPSAPLVFRYNDTAIGSGYHVTELRHSTSTGIDCGGTVETWDEARLQLLDGHGSAHMRVGKFTAIVQSSVSKLPGLSDAPLLVEFAPGNDGLRMLTTGTSSTENGTVTLTLYDAKAQCKPATRTASACCG
ncbi:MAG: DUF6428 family protein [Pseudomonadota bacterium]